MVIDIAIAMFAITIRIDLVNMVIIIKNIRILKWLEPKNYYKYKLPIKFTIFKEDLPISIIKVVG